MSAPKLFGFPLWRRLKRRIAKKYLRRYDREWFFHLAADRHLATAGIGSLVQACAGLNERITWMSPQYIRVGHGEVLFDIDFSSPTNGFSLRHCGVDKPLTYDECIKYCEEAVQRAVDEGDPYGFAKSYKIGDGIIVNNDGTYTRP